jgi:peptidoglycan/xylan/chitin deacetylase (PgdA/CDA1 family)
MVAIVASFALVAFGTALIAGSQARATSIARSTSSSPTTLAIATPLVTVPATVVPPSAAPAATARASAAPESAPPPLPVATFPPLAEGVVPILYLHRVEAPPPDFPTWSADKQERFLAYDVLPTAFDAQLDWLQAHGYTTILPRDLARHWDHGAPLPARPVIISLDDGFPSWTRTVLPMLEAHRMIAEFYLTIVAIAPGRMTWDDVRELARAGNGIGAHDVHHIQLTALGPDLPAASVGAMWDEIHEARVIIGQELGTPPDSMAYVGGGFDATLESLVRQAGYTTARSILRGIDQTQGQRFALRVIRIGSRDDVVDVLTGELLPGLPIFAAKMAGARS